MQGSGTRRYTCIRLFMHSFSEEKYMWRGQKPRPKKCGKFRLFFPSHTRVMVVSEWNEFIVHISASSLWRKGDGRIRGKGATLRTRRSIFTANAANYCIFISVSYLAAGLFRLVGFPVVCSCIGLGGINLAVIFVRELRLFLYGLNRFFYFHYGENVRHNTVS